MSTLIIYIDKQLVEGYLIHQGTFSIIYSRSKLFSNESEESVNEITKQLLIDTVLHIIELGKTKLVTVYITSFIQEWEEMSDVFMHEFYQQVGFPLKVISKQQESYLMEKAFNENLNLHGNVLLCNIGQNQIEYIIQREKETVFSHIAEFGTKDVLDAFSHLAKNDMTIRLEEVLQFIAEHLEIPTIGCKYALFSGKQLSYVLASQYPYHENNFFEDIHIPYYVTPQEFEHGNKDSFNHKSLLDIQKQVPENPDMFLDARAVAIITQYIIEVLEVDYFFPTDINLVNGVILEN